MNNIHLHIFGSKVFFNLIEDLLDFRPHKIKEMMETGYHDAKTKFIL